MRVAVVAEWYPSPADPVHGVWAHHQATASVAAGASVQVLAMRRPVPPLSLARQVLRSPRQIGALGAWLAGVRRTLAPWMLDGVPIHSVPWLGPPRPLSYGTWGWWMAPSLGQALDRMYSAWPFDVLHAHLLAPTGQAAARWLAARAFERDGPAFVVSAHGGDMIRVPEASALGRRAVLTALDRADLLIANSSWAQRRCEEIAGRALASRVVHLGATVAGPRAAVGPLPAASGPRPEVASLPAVSGSRPASGDGRLRLITIAHLQERKHHHVVLQALARLPAECRPDYLIVGDGEMRDALQARVDALGLRDRVTFAGQLDNASAVALLPDQDLFVMPGVEEPFGVAFVEAMAAGVPAVGSRYEGGPQDIAAAGEGMLLVDADDDAELAALIAQLDHDRAELKRLAAAAASTARAHFTWERCGVATVEAYADALRRHGALVS